MQIYTGWKKFRFLKNLECLSLISVNSTREGKAISKKSRKERSDHTIIGSLSCTLSASRSHGRLLVRKIPQILKGQTDSYVDNC